MPTRPFTPIINSLPDVKKMKIMTIVGTRPEIIKLSRVIDELDQYTELVFVHTGQNYDYELNEIFFQQLNIRKPDVFLDAAGDTPARTVGQVIAKTDDVLASHNPDALLILGDTNSCLAAYPAKRRKIPIFHMEAGNRCFDQRVPEEINRRIIDHISDINLPYTEHARRYLLREGLKPETVIKTGSPMKEVLDFYRPIIEQSDVMGRMAISSSARTGRKTSTAKSTFVIFWIRLQPWPKSTIRRSLFLRIPGQESAWSRWEFPAWIPAFAS